MITLNNAIHTHTYIVRARSFVRNHYHYATRERYLLEDNGTLVIDRSLPIEFKIVLLASVHVSHGVLKTKETEKVFPQIRNCTSLPFAKTSR